MSLSPTAAWSAAVTGADGSRIRVLVDIYDGSTHWKCVDNSMDSTSDLASTPVGLSTRPGQVAADVDPLTRAAGANEFVAEFIDEYLRPIIVSTRIVGKQMTVKVGEASLDEADFLAVAVTCIDQVEARASDGIIRVTGLDGYGVLARAQVVGSWIGKHPLEVLYAGDGTGILERAGWGAFNTASLDPADARHDDITHYLLRRNNDAVSSPTSALELVNDICQLLYASLVFDESGAATIVRYDPSATAVASLTANDIIPGTFEQEALESNVINRVVVRYGGGEDGNGDPRSYVANETASQAAYAYPGTSERVITHEIDAEWFDLAARVNSTIAVGATSITLPGAHVWGLTGSNGATIDSDHPVWLCIDGSLNPGGLPPEIVKAEACTPSADAVVTYNDPDTLRPGQMDTHAELTYSSVSRGQLGTTAREFVVAVGKPITQAFDITIPVNVADTILERFAYGCPVISFETPASLAHLQIGDAVDVTYPRYVAYGSDGLTTSTVWEIVSKEMILDSEPRIKWRLAEIRTNVITRSSDWLSGSPLRGIGSASQMWGSVARSFVADGLVAAPGTGLAVDVTAGYVTNGSKLAKLGSDASLTVGASKDTYISMCGLTGALIYRQVANGAAAPTIPDGEVYLAKAVSDGAGVTSVSTTGRVTNPVLGSKLEAGTGPLTHLGAAGAFDSLANVTARTFDLVADDPAGTWRKVAGVDASNQASSSSIANSAISNTHISATAAIVGTKLKEGTGPLTHLSSTGALDNITSVTNRSLDNITDGSTYKRVTGVDGSNKVTSSSMAASSVNSTALANGAVASAAKVADGAVGLIKLDLAQQFGGSALNANAAMSMFTNG